MTDFNPPSDAQQQTQPSTENPDGHQVLQSGGATDGLVKCPSCGSTDIGLNIPSAQLRCSFCRHEWLPPSADSVYGINGDISLLTGTVIGAGSKDIQASVDLVRTFKCSGCGAEIVIDTAEALQARCHWCRNTLSVNEQIDNGAVPDMVLPFAITKDAAVEKIREFVSKRMYFAHPKFKAEFTPENVMGVYLPYMVIDVNAHATFNGEGEHETARYTVRSGDDTETRYDADVYRVGREFDVQINDLTVESSTERLDRGLHNTNNIINAIMPFDVENSVTWDANFLKGFASERRDADIAQLMPLMNAQSTDIARFLANDTLTFYDRGVRWDRQDLAIKGQRWVAAYLPVWLYSYHQTKGNGAGMLHYVAVNGRNGETMGSVPLHYPKLIGVSAIVEIVALVLAIIIMIALGG